MGGLRPKTGLDLVEEAAYLLRSAPPGALAAYYAGTLPFTLAFLFFWADMGSSATAYEHCAPAALGVAAAFLWMSAWQGVFTQGLRTVLTGGEAGPFRGVTLVQMIVQPTKLVIIPIAALITVPLGAAFAFYQNLGAISFNDAPSLRAKIASALRQARLWPGQNWAALGIMAMLAILVFANVSVLLLLAPQLLKTFLGIQTALARGELIMLNTTFLAITAALTYAIVDPFIKAMYVLRCYHGEALVTGEDLKSQLKAITAASQLVLIAVILGNVSLPLRAGTGADPVVVQRINHSIDEVLKRPEFTWRLPERPSPRGQKNWFARTLDSFLDTLDRWSDEFFRWLHERFRPLPAASQKPGLPGVRLWFYVLLGAALLISIVLLSRAFRRTPHGLASADIASAVPDLDSDETLAGQLPTEEWLRAARECVTQNDLRRAVRALFLANLSYLAGRSLIAIERGKSNRDYERELRRRTRSKPEIMPVFSDTVAAFERTWYGTHEAGPDLVARIEANLASTRTRVEQ